MSAQHTAKPEPVAYFTDFYEAQDFGGEHCTGYPSWRVVSYGQGYAVQVRPGGVYLADNGQPTLANKDPE